MRRLRTWTRDRRGIVAVEFALLAPFLMVLLVGLFEVVSLVRVSLKLSHAANSLAQMVADQTTPANSSYATSRSELTDLCKGAGYELAPYAASNLSAAIVSVTASKVPGSPTKDWEVDTACSATASSFSTSAISLAQGVTANGNNYALTPNLGDSAIVVRASYAYTPVLHYVLGSSWTLNQTAFARPRQQGAVTCSDC